MLDTYLIINKKVLPDTFAKVIEAKKRLAIGKCKGITEACKEVGISRSVYYKYKDDVFESEDVSVQRRAVISFMLSHQKGKLSKVIALITKSDCSVLTINQNIPINNQANVNLSLDISDMQITPEDLIASIRQLEGVSRVQLLALE